MDKLINKNKEGGALRRLREKNFEAIVLVLQIGLGGLIFVCLKATEVYFRIKTRVYGLLLLKTCGYFQNLLNFSSKNMGMLHIK